MYDFECLYIVVSVICIEHRQHTATAVITQLQRVTQNALLTVLSKLARVRTVSLTLASVSTLLCCIASAAAVVDVTQEFLQAAESLTCPYQWGRYDLLCLPPSFPYGGMENPVRQLQSFALYSYKVKVYS
jgi:hypothetical protein